MGTRLRNALMSVSPCLPSPLKLTPHSIDEAPQHYFTLLGAFFATRSWIVRHLLPPRPEFLRKRFVTADEDPDPETGKYHVLHWNDVPWYVKPTFWNRQSPGALLTRLTGGVVPGDPAYLPGGYLASELGPENFRGKGDAEMEKARAELREKTRRRIAAGGCPMSFHENCDRWGRIGLIEEKRKLETCQASSNLACLNHKHRPLHDLRPSHSSKTPSTVPAHALCSHNSIVASNRKRNTRPSVAMSEHDNRLRWVIQKLIPGGNGADIFLDWLVS